MKTHVNKKIQHKSRNPFFFFFGPMDTAWCGRLENRAVWFYYCVYRKMRNPKFQGISSFGKKALHDRRRNENFSDMYASLKLRPDTRRSSVSIVLALIPLPDNHLLQQGPKVPLHHTIRKLNRPHQPPPVLGEVKGPHVLIDIASSLRVRLGRQPQHHLARRQIFHHLVDRQPEVGKDGPQRPQRLLKGRVILGRHLHRRRRHVPLARRRAQQQDGGYVHAVVGGDQRIGCAALRGWGHGLYLAGSKQCGARERGFGLRLWLCSLSFVFRS